MKNQELIAYLDRIIKYIEENLEHSSLFLCTMFIDLNLSKNDSITKEYKKFIIENKPTPTLHSIFYAHKRFVNREGISVWWVASPGSPSTRREVNTQRLLFIKHLKEQLEQGIINP